MPRAERRKARRSEGRWSAWWLAVPVLGIAAYAAFSATLALLGEDPSRAPAGVVHDDAPARGTIASPPVAAPAPPSEAEAPVVPAAAPPTAPAAAVDAATPSPSPADAPSASATPATRRAAADKARKVKPKRAPHEHLTEQDHRALDAIIEQAGKNAR